MNLPSHWNTIADAEADVARKRVKLAAMFEAANEPGADKETAARNIKSANEELQQLVDKLQSAKAAKAANPTLGQRRINPNDDLTEYAASGRKAFVRQPDGEWGAAVVNAIADSQASGLKSSIVPSGTAVVPVPIGGPIEDPRRGRFLSELIPSDPAPGGHFSYLRQTVRDFAAAEVADLATKPTSNIALELVEGTTPVIAHLSPATPRHFFEDSRRVQQFVESEMRLGLNLAIDARIVSTVLATAGILQQGELGTDPLFTTRRALTRLQEREVEPSAYAMNPRDWEEVERAAQETFAANPGQNTPADAMARRLWGVPVFVTNALDEGTILLGDFAGSALLYRAVPDNFGDGMQAGVQLQWSEAGVSDGVSDFDRNALKVRAETRLEVAVLRDFAFVSIATPTTGS
jgi:HK97 family phage major capsid protein